MKINLDERWKEKLVYYIHFLLATVVEVECSSFITLQEILLLIASSEFLNHVINFNIQGAIC